MTRRRYIILGGTVAMLTGIIILVVSLLVQDVPTEEAEGFCDAFPNALFCQETNPTEIDIAEDMMVSLMAHYPNVMSESFCTNYFYGILTQYCLNDPSIIVPSDFNIVSSSFIIVEFDEGIYDIRTRYSNNVPAYTIRVSLNNADGAYHISGFSYFDTPATLDLEQTDEELELYIQDLIASGEDNEDRLCEIYFTWISYSECQQNSDPFVLNPELSILYQVERQGTNHYHLIFTNSDESEAIHYDVVFENVDGQVKISTFEETAISLDETE